MLFVIYTKIFGKIKKYSQICEETGKADLYLKIAARYDGCAWQRRLRLACSAGKMPQSGFTPPLRETFIRNML